MAVESTIERWVAKHALEDYGVESTKFGYDGWPDRIFWVPAPPLLIEFKAPGGTLMPRQAYRIERLKKLGYEVQVHDNCNEALAAVVNAINKTRQL